MGIERQEKLLHQRAAKLLIVLAACFLTPAAAFALDLPDAVKSSVTVIASRLEKNAYEYEYKIDYPVFPEYPELNTVIEKLITGRLGTFPEDSVNFWKDMRENFGCEWAQNRAPLHFSVSWKIEQINTRYISILMETYEFSGGAHGRTLLDALNFDCTLKKTITLADIIPYETSRTLKEISTQARSSLNGTLNPDGRDDLTEWIDTGTAPDYNNYLCFTFTDDILTFYFQQYQVAPYAMGLPSVKISRKALALP